LVNLNIGITIMSTGGIIGSIIFLIIFCFGFYKYSISQDGGVVDKMKILQRIFVIFIIIGFASLYSQTKDTEFKGFWLVCIVLLMNIYTVIYSTDKCKYPTLYKIKLVLWTSLVIGIISIILWYATYGSMFGMKPANKDINELTSVLTGDTLRTGELFKGVIDCPDPSTKEYSNKFNKLKQDDPDKARKCLSYYQTLDVDKGIYA